MSNKAMITNIQRFSINDGPGIRTSVFIKGCRLHCSWCHNPECIHSFEEIYWKPMLCRQCGRCFSVCPQGAIQPPIEPGIAENEYYYKIDVSKCDRCMKCVEVCPFNALTKVGDLMSVEEVLDEVERDMLFYSNSGGGMTITGGEPTTVPEFTLELLQKAKERGLHNCLDTCGFCEWEILDSMRPFVDIFLYDVKCMNNKLHIMRTGVNNSPILTNLVRLAETGSDIHVRIPVIPGLNDSTEHMERVADYLEALKPAVKQVDLLPFHNWCQDKYRWLGLQWEYTDVESMSSVEVEDLRDILEERGLHTTIGG